MSGDKLDSETLAELLDGKLTGQARADALRRLANDPEAYETFVEASAVLGELVRGNNVVPIQRKGSRFRLIPTATVGVLLAAGVASVLILPRLAQDQHGYSEIIEGDALVGPGGSLNQQWFLPLDTRGGAVTPAGQRRAFEAGVRAADLKLALEAQDTSAASVSRRDLAGIVEGEDASAPIVARINAAANPDDVIGQLADFYDSNWFELGMLIEQIRVANAAGKLASLNSGTARAIEDLSRELTTVSGDIARDLQLLADEIQGSANSGTRVDALIAGIVGTVTG